MVLVRQHPDVVIAELAARQHGVVSRRQLVAAGVTDRVIDHRIGVRRLRRVHAGVYAAGGSELTPPPRHLAAVLACGAGALLSHRSAAALWDLRPAAAESTDVTIPRGGGRRQAGIVVHTTRSLAPADCSTCGGVPCTSPARTLLDLAAVVSPRSLARALEQSVILRLFDRNALGDVLARANGRRGAGTLRRLLDVVDDVPPPSRSELERRFLDLLRDAALPMAVVNGSVAGYEVDFHWPAARLVVETDGRATHDNVLAFERDRARDLDLELAGWRVVRISWRQLHDHPERIVALLRARL